MNTDKIRNPKQRFRGDCSRGNWFRYYAGFSEGFVEDIIKQLDLTEGATLLDPWVGAGTTAQVAIAKGYRTTGFDLNPAMLLVARARTLATSVANQIPAVGEAIFRLYERSGKSGNTSSFPTTEPLEQWLQPAAAHAFRLLERSAFSIFTQPESRSMAPMWSRVERASAIVAFFYVALFRALRRFISEFQSSNPTWFKISDGKGRVHLPSGGLVGTVSKEIEGLLSALRSERQAMPVVNGRTCVLKRSSSLQLPLSSRSVEAVISSPPYCTRIDYVRATLPELAVIGYPNGDAIRQLRQKMIGTPTIKEIQVYYTEEWGTTCSGVLTAVEHHPSKASSTYYLKCYLQYFASVFASFQEIDRVLKKSGQCVLVVQDSYYKDVRIDLPRIFVEMAGSVGWHLHEKADFHVKQTLAGINPDVRQYRDACQATESVLWFSK